MTKWIETNKKPPAKNGDYLFCYGLMDDEDTYEVMIASYKNGSYYLGSGVTLSEPLYWAVIEFPKIDITRMYKFDIIP